MEKRKLVNLMEEKNREDNVKSRENQNQKQEGQKRLLNGIYVTFFPICVGKSKLHVLEKMLNQVLIEQDRQKFGKFTADEMYQ